MATFVKHNNVVISIDPGFDSNKIVINGIIFNIPNNVIDVTGKAEQFLSLNGNRRAAGYLLSKYIPGKEYLVGSLARKSMMEAQERNLQSEREGMMDSIGRFQTTEFEVGLMTSVALAIVKYAEASVKNHWKPEINLRDPEQDVTVQVTIGVALPNDWVDAVWPSINRFLVGLHEFPIETNEGHFNVKFEIQEGHAMGLSQAVCALLGAATDDEGITRPESEILRNLPCLVVDGGYKTVGIVLLTQAMQVAYSESNTDYAMGNVHKKVTKILQDDYGRSNIHSFQIPTLLEEGGIVHYLVEADGHQKTKAVDINDIVEKEEDNVCEEMIDYMNDKFENLLDIHSILVTGGTGDAYYPRLRNYLEDERGHLTGHIILTNYEFQGQPISPVHAIAVGMYKVLKNQINKAAAAKRQAAKEQ